MRFEVPRGRGRGRRTEGRAHHRSHSFVEHFESSFSHIEEAHPLASEINCEEERKTCARSTETIVLVGGQEKSSSSCEALRAGKGELVDFPPNTHCRLSPSLFLPFSLIRRA